MNYKIPSNRFWSVSLLPVVDLFRFFSSFFNSVAVIFDGIIALFFTLLPEWLSFVWWFNIETSANLSLQILHMTGFKDLKISSVCLPIFAQWSTIALSWKDWQAFESIHNNCTHHPLVQSLFGSVSNRRVEHHSGTVYKNFWHNLTALSGATFLIGWYQLIDLFLFSMTTSGRNEEIPFLSLEEFHTQFDILGKTYVYESISQCPNCALAFFRKK